MPRSDDRGAKNAQKPDTRGPEGETRRERAMGVLKGGRRRVIEDTIMELRFCQYPNK